MAISQLTNKWILVTGAASGIGLETARAFARRRSNVIITDVNEAALGPIQREIEALGVRCLSHGLDVAHEADVHRVAESVMASVGAPHIIVNNAGIGFLGPLLHTPTAVWHQVLNVNVMGVVHLCQAFLPAMLKAGDARQIVNVASAMGVGAAPNLGAYCASKHAVMGLSDALAMELADTKVGVTIVCPGVIDTPIVRNRRAVANVVPDAQMDKIEAHYKKTGAHPSEVAERIVKAAQRGEDIVFVGPTARALYIAKRLSRKLASVATLAGCKANGYWWPYTDKLATERG